MIRSTVKFHLGWKGRLNRLSYFVAMLIFFYGGLSAVGLTMILSETLLGEEHILFRIIVVPLLVLAITLIWIVFTSTIKRFHDMNRSGKWLILAIFLPIPVNFILLMGGLFPIVIALKIIGSCLLLFGIGCLLFVPGTIGRNRFGPDPRTEKVRRILFGKSND